MRVVVRNGEAEVELADTASYNPTVMRDLCDLAISTYDRAFDDDDATVETETGEAQPGDKNF